MTIGWLMSDVESLTQQKGELIGHTTNCSTLEMRVVNRASTRLATEEVAMPVPTETPYVLKEPY
jgi:hypothetical protein